MGFICNYTEWELSQSCNPSRLHPSLLHIASLPYAGLSVSFPQDPPAQGFTTGVVHICSAHCCLQSRSLLSPFPGF